jgi:hypothetical protein
LNWANVEWVDFTSQCAKAKVDSFNLTANAVPESYSYALIFGVVATAMIVLKRRRKA